MSYIGFISLKGGAEKVAKCRTSTFQYSSKKVRLSLIDRQTRLEKGIKPSLPISSWQEKKEYATDNTSAKNKNKGEYPKILFSVFSTLRHLFVRRPNWTPFFTPRHVTCNSGSNFGHKRRRKRKKLRDKFGNCKKSKCIQYSVYSTFTSFKSFFILYPA